MFDEVSIITLGVLFQSLLMLKRKTVKRLLVPLGAAVFVFFTGLLESTDSLLITPLVVYIFTFAYVNKDQLLPAINERSLLILTAVFWFMMYTNTFFSPFRQFLVIPGLILSILTICLSLLKIPLHQYNTLAYTWYLCIIFLVSILQLNRESNLQGLGGLFLQGMTIMYLGSHGAFLLKLVPLPEKHRPYSEVIKEWREYRSFLGSKFDDLQTNPLHTMLITLTALGLLYYSWSTSTLPSFLVLNSIILVSPHLTRTEPTGRLLSAEPIKNVVKR